MLPAEYWGAAVKKYSEVSGSIKLGYDLPKRFWLSFLFFSPKLLMEASSTLLATILMSAIWNEIFHKNVPRTLLLHVLNVEQCRICTMGNFNYGYYYESLWCGNKVFGGRLSVNSKVPYTWYEVKGSKVNFSFREHFLLFRIGWYLSLTKSNGSLLTDHKEPGHLLPVQSISLYLKNY